MLVLTQENIILYVLLALVVFMILSKKTSYENFGEEENLASNLKLDKNMCSIDCCGTQWPVSFATKRDDRVNPDDKGDKFVPTNYTCSGLRGRGCLCATKQQYEFLMNRGNNS